MGFPIRVGAKGPEVRDLRHRLCKWAEENPEAQVHLTPGDVFDEATEAAVRALQTHRCLTPRGIVDRDTWDSLVESGFHLGDRLLWFTSEPMRGDDVLELQTRLNQLGFQSGREDGVFSATLDHAIREFQDHMGIEVDGVAGPRTLKQLKYLHREHMESGMSAQVREREDFEQVARAGLAGMVILIDPASNKTPDLNHDTLTDWTWTMGTLLHARLSAMGASPVLSRGPANDPSTGTRAQFANRIGAKLVVSISLAAHPNSHHRGAHAFYFASPSPQSSFTSPVGQDLAYAAMQAVREIDPGVPTEIAPRTWTMLRGTRMPAVIIEPAHGTHAESLAKWSEPTTQRIFVDRLSDAIANLVLRYTR